MIAKLLNLPRSAMAVAFFSSSLFLAGTNFATGQDQQEEEDPIKVRQSIMEEVGDASKVLGNMVKGEFEYHPEVARDGITFLRDAMVEFVKHFPDDSEEGDTEASANIWLDMEGFLAAAKKMETDADEAIEVAGTGVDGLKEGFGKVAANCKGCHQDFREKKF